MRPPNGLPVHPECRHHTRPAVPCICAELWNGWDGSDDDLQRRIDARRRHEGKRRERQDIGILEDESTMHGFWSEAENLKTILASRKNQG